MKVYILLLLLTLGAVTMSHAQDSQNYEKATFAGGCFWCIESAFEDIDGVISAVSGYTGGEKANPSYQEVTTGRTGHFEAVEITFDPTKASYEQLLDVFWRNIDPTQSNGQFADIGSQYHTAIFYHNDQQKEKAEKSKADLDKNGPFKKPIVTEILPAETFYAAEDYHQDYYKKNPIHYKTYKYMSGRGPFIDRTWKK